MEHYGLNLLIAEGLDSSLGTILSTICVAVVSGLGYLYSRQSKRIDTLETKRDACLEEKVAILEQNAILKGKMAAIEMRVTVKVDDRIDEKLKEAH